MPKKERKLLGERMRKSEAPAGFKNKPLLSALPLSEGSADLSFEDFEIHDPEARCRELHLLWPESQFWHRVLLSKKRSKHFKFDIR